MPSINGREIALAIFDMDGLVLDSERVYLEMWKKTARILGYEMTTEQWFGLLGTNAETERLYLLSLYGSDCPTEKFREIRVRLINEYADRLGIPVKTGFDELSAFLKNNGIPAVIATSSSRERAERYLTRAGVIGAFLRLTCGDEVKRGKPDPEIFLRAAKKEGVAPEKCVVFEDSANGVMAAVNAGMLPVCVPDLQPPTDAVKKAAVVVKTLDGIIKQINI